MQTTLPATRTCATCPEFLKSGNTGICQLHGCRVLPQDKACSSWYQEPEPGTAEEDEFSR
jgi:hypothetical protein